MITSEFPYVTEGSSPGAYVSSHLQGGQAGSLLAPGSRRQVPADLAGIVHLLLQRDPDQRYESAEAALADLVNVVVPDLCRYEGTETGVKVAEAWRNRVRRSLVDTRRMQALRPSDLL